MQKKWVWPLIAILCAGIIGAGLFFGLRGCDSDDNQQHGLTSRPGQTSQTTVYVTRTGKCYHRANCRYLSKSKIPMSLEEAKKRYRPCSVCNPPR